MKDDIVYIVTGCWCSGTSMMIDCLVAGGLVLGSYSYEHIDTSLRPPLQFGLCSNGFYQPVSVDDGFFYHRNKGKLVRLEFSSLSKLPTGKYKIIFMKKSPEHIRTFMRKWIPYVTWGMAEVATYFSEQIIIALNTMPLDITFLDYSDVVANPRKAFERLRDWNIDIDNAIATINPLVIKEKV